MCEYLNKSQTLEKINEISSMHPYPIPGEPRTYNNYNQGWSDACRLISDLVQFDPPSMVAEIPCKVGGFLWSIIRPVGLHLKAKDAPYPCRVVFIGLNDSKNFGGGFVNVVFKNKGGREMMLQFNFNQFGSLIFKSKEDALTFSRE